MCSPNRSAVLTQELTRTYLFGSLPFELPDGGVNAFCNIPDIFLLLGPLMHALFRAHSIPCYLKSDILPASGRKNARSRPPMR